jgi:hypothetical protein
MTLTYLNNRMRRFGSEFRSVPSTPRFVDMQSARRCIVFAHVVHTLEVLVRLSCHLFTNRMEKS